MSPAEAAQALREELEAAFLELADVGRPPQVHAVHPPQDLGADRDFLITISAGEADPLEIALPAGLALGYLADEEAAVDEWHHWVSDAYHLLAADTPD